MSYNLPQQSGGNARIALAVPYQEQHLRLPAGRDKGESRMKKRLWTIALALAVVMGLLTVSALAADDTADDGRNQRYKIDPLYTTDGSNELPAAPEQEGDVWTVNPANAQYTLDGAYGSIDGKTIHFDTGEYKDVLVLARPNKFVGSGTTYYSNTTGANDALEYEKLEESPAYHYSRTISNVTFTAEDGVVLPGFEQSSGHKYGSGSTSVYDYVRETETTSSVGSHYDYCSLIDVTFDGLTIQKQIKFADGSTSVTGFAGNMKVDGITIQNCTFQGKNGIMEGTTLSDDDKIYVAIKMNTEKNSFDNISIISCNITNYYQGIYIQASKNITVSNCFINGTRHNAIALQDGGQGPKTIGDVLITENLIQNAKDRAIRFGNAPNVASVTIKNNIMLSSGDETGELIKAGTLPTDTSNISLDYNYWNGKIPSSENKVVVNVPVPTTTGVTRGTFPLKVEQAEPCCADRYIAVDNRDGTVTVTYDDSEVFPKGDGSEKNPYIISNAGELIAFRDAVNAGVTYYGKYIRVVANIDISDEEWVPIGTTPEGFQGTFDGQNHTITGLTMTSTDEDKGYYNAMDTGDYYAYGFFGGIRHATVKDINFEEVDINQPGGTGTTATKNNTVGAVVGAALNGSTIENITVSGTVTGYSRAAGIVGYVGGSKTAPDTLITGEDVFNMGDITVRNCTNNAEITSSWSTTSHGTAAGICATVNQKSSTSGTVVFESNTNTGAVNGYCAAGILASSFANTADGATMKVTFDGNTNDSNGAITGTGSAAGIAITNTGKTDDGFEYALDGNRNLGDVTATQDATGVASGIISIHDSYKVTFGSDGNSNSGSVSGYTAGGITASAQRGVDFEHLTNSGKVTATSGFAGGIVGQINGTSTLDGASCTNSGTVTSSDGVSGTLVGNLENDPTVKNISDAAAIGAVQITGGGHHDVVFENVKIDTLNVTAGHNAQSAGNPYWWFTIQLKDSSTIGTVTVSGHPGTGLDLAISGGEVDKVDFADITDAAGEDGYTNTLRFAAKDGAKVGTVQISDTTETWNFRVGTEENSSINLVDAKAETTVHIGDEAGITSNALENKGTITTIRTVKNTVTVREGGEAVTNILYVTDDLSADSTAGKILDGTNSTKKFTGVSLSADEEVSGTLTIADGKTLVIEKDTTLTIEKDATFTNSGEILVYGELVDNRKNPSEGTGTVTHFYTVTFNNEEVASEVTVEGGKLLAEPAQPSKPGYVFQGWYTAQTGGEKWDFAKPVTGDMTLYARWSVYVAPNPSYPIAIADSENGAVTSSHIAATAGSTVTLTAVPEEGYELASLTVTDYLGNQIALSGSGSRYAFTMPASQVKVTAVFTKTGEPTLPFTDVSEDNWAYGDIVYVYENGLMQGDSATIFDRLSSISRKEIVTILYRLAGEPAVTADNGFADVAGGVWYADAVNWAVAEGITRGVGGNRFDPDAAITRQDLAVMLWRYAGEPAGDPSVLEGYRDADSVSGYARAALAWAVEQGIVTGVGDSTLDPMGSAQRQQAAAMIRRLAESVQA